ncbi:MAG TPA: hypothetical protein VF503_13730 [Sphingobium sp.]|uniref:hypothetical protein n=1 Tax=Sphingobium sp. TaxID=1912891 RepID=UPI002ED4C180
MARITIRLDDALLGHIADQAERAATSPSAYIREVLARVEGDPLGYHARFDELHATTIQALAILAASVGSRSPAILEKGQADARRLLRERGLLDTGQDRP